MINNSQNMRVLGIDPGIASTGYGILNVDGNQRLKVECWGVIKTSPKDKQEKRLKIIFDKISRVIAMYNPEVVAVETIFHSKNLKSLVDVSEAIGVISLAAYNYGLEVEKFTPLEVKSAITGFGKADKPQILLMLKQLLKLDDFSVPSHASDAIAVAVCYLYLSGY